LASTWFRPATVPAADAERLFGKALEHEYSGIELMRRPGVTYDDVAAAAVVAAHPSVVSRETLTEAEGSLVANAVIEQIEIAVKYAGYIDKQREEVSRAVGYERLRLPEDIDYSLVTALSFEVRQTLLKRRPATLGEASRLSGITPAAISLLLIHLKRGKFHGFTDGEQPTESVEHAG
jgi:tRNA uridine 5-carboxymethylaminomethyl modification enzyme